ncbi:hypothetical protein YH63_001835 [Afipia massiliensis]|uniref:Uncharacterized protein n=1 Tax=Afipia massiliensis TaxID=211460 RepID=A0A4U6BJB7_9BRAD|nr:hypothetical protein YH63_001835 [Afipia massiliensis]
MPDDLCTIDISPIVTVARTARWTVGMTRRLAADGDQFVVIGGDHSCAISTWNGMSDALRNTWPEYSFAAADIFMCGGARPYQAAQVLRDALRPEFISISEHRRGIQQ